VSIINRLSKAKMQNLVRRIKDSYFFFFFTADEMQEGSTADKSRRSLKVDRSAKRIQWLKKNQKLLTMLLNYCSLHGASGGDLAGNALLLFDFLNS